MAKEESSKKGGRKFARPASVIGSKGRAEIEKNFAVNGVIPRYLHGHIPSRLDRADLKEHWEDFIQRGT